MLAADRHAEHAQEYQYERHRPAETALYRIVSTYWTEFRELLVASAKPYVPPQENTVLGPLQLPLIGKVFDEPEANVGHKRRKPWAWLLKHVFAVDVNVCPKCGARMTQQLQIAPGSMRFRMPDLKDFRLFDHAIDVDSCVRQPRRTAKSMDVHEMTSLSKNGAWMGRQQIDRCVVMVCRCSPLFLKATACHIRA